jgi:SAM-dependent methyltransferase
MTASDMIASDTSLSPNTKPPAFVVRAMRALWRLLTDPPYRHVQRLRITRSQKLYQPANTTFANRYPRIFRFVQTELGADSDARLLSYGCSTGEEAFSLRQYFPRATIKGIDINPGNIAICRRRLKEKRDGAISFETASSTTAEPSGSYDAIFCMAVLRHGDLKLPGVTRCDHLIRFEDFAASVEDLTRCLKPGGLLVIIHSNFRLCDAPAGAEFETILRVRLRLPSDQMRFFGSDNRLIEGMQYPDVVFRKKSNRAA